MNVFKRSVAACYTPGVSWKNPHGCVSREAQTPSLLGQVCQPFHLFKFTTLQTQVSRVSIDRRGSPSLCSAQRGRYIVSGLHTLRSATPQRVPLPSHRSPNGPFQATRSPVKGRTTQHLTYCPLVGNFCKFRIDSVKCRCSVNAGGRSSVTFLCM
jgi:hypothetical protein